MEAPLCTACVVEMELDGVKEESVVVQRGLRRVDKVDGGLTRRRWEAKEREKDRRGPGHGHVGRPPKPHARESSLRGGDGADGELASIGHASTNCLISPDSTIWVNVFDPINGPSFKPSPLKPIPLFIQRPASIFEVQRQAPTVTEHLSLPGLRGNLVSGTTAFETTPQAVVNPVLRRTKSRAWNPVPSTPRTSSIRPPTPLRGHSPTSSCASSREYFGDVGPLDLRRQPPFAMVREEPLKRPSSRLGASRRRSKANSSAYQTPPEYPDPLSNFSYPRPLSIIRTISPLPSQLSSQTHRVVHAAPPQSSEYLERYRPIVTAGLRRPLLLTEPSSRVRIRRSLEQELEEGNFGVDVEDVAERNADDGKGWGRVGAELRRFFAGQH
ncbi:hypothetical protein B0J13DRAFT_517594 [Dactylonectria estremocensis]|uniref:Uncharacterized protein n=1 Tax=Dactylonectria estremocensis TaxID=1079267 RepID=A0A9P9JI57_9HYPO|nr:hypothetical protein B0J13DRAFT_517594 [Dactylonectria estremocensis]